MASARTARACPRRRATCSVDGGSSGRNSIVDRPAPRGTRTRDVRDLVETLDELERAAADVEDQDPIGGPAVPAAHGEERELCLLFAREHAQAHAGLLGDLVEHRLAIRGLANRGGREREEFVESGSSSCVGGGGHGVDDRSDADVTDRAVRLEVAHEPQHGLLRRRRDGSRAPMGIDDEEMHGVGTDVENTEAHVVSVLVGGCGHDVFRAYWCDWDDRPTSVGDGVERSRVARIPAPERRSALIEAALRVVSRNGIAQATTRAIVAEAGMSLASFHYAFDSRDELIDELITTVVAREQQAIIPEVLPGQDLREILESGILRYFEHLKADPAHEQAMLELTQYALRSSERHPLAVAQYARYAELGQRSLDLAASAADAEWRVPVAEVARVLVAFTDGLTLTWLVDRDDDAARAVAHAAADALSRMADTR